MSSLQWAISVKSKRPGGSRITSTTSMIQEGELLHLEDPHIDSRVTLPDLGHGVYGNIFHLVHEHNSHLITA